MSPVVGSEQGGIRPVLVVQNDVGNRFSPTVIVAPLTSRNKSNLPTHTTIAGFGLSEESVVLCEQVRTIDKHRLKEKCDHVSPEVMEQIESALQISLGLRKGEKKVDSLQIFKNPEFGEIRTFEEPDGEVSFCGSDAAKALGYENTRDALIRHCKNEGVVNHDILTNGGTQQAKFISEGNLYRLIAGSKLPSAQRFESWIFDDVVPSIRKHGAYVAPETLDRMIASPEFGIKLLTALKDEQEKRKAAEAHIEADKPKVLFADSVCASETSILVGEMAKLLKQNGIEIGEKRFFQYLRANGYLISRFGTDYNMPTQKSMELKIFEVKETSITHSSGTVTVSKTPKITGKGQKYFINKFLAEREAAGK